MSDIDIALRLLNSFGDLGAHGDVLFEAWLQMNTVTVTEKYKTRTEQNIDTPKLIFHSSICLSFERSDGLVKCSLEQGVEV